MKEQRWGYAPEPKPERWSGSFATRAEAVEAGRGAYPDEAFYVCSGNLAWGPGYMPTANELEETIWLAAYEEVGDAAEEFPDLTPEAKTELGTILQAWAAKHVQATFWIANRTPQRIEPAAQQPLRETLSVKGIER